MKAAFVHGGQNQYDPEAHGALCQQCPLRTERVGGPVPPEGDLKSTMMLIGEGPARNECVEGRPFVGRAGVELGAWLKEAGLDRKRVWVSNALLCMVERADVGRYRATVRKRNIAEKRAAKQEKRPPALVNDPIAMCRPRLMREWSAVQKNAVKRGLQPVAIPLGATALEALTGKKLSITKWQGSPIVWR